MIKQYYSGNYSKQYIYKRDIVLDLAQKIATYRKSKNTNISHIVVEKNKILRSILNASCTKK